MVNIKSGSNSDYICISVDIENNKLGLFELINCNRQIMNYKRCLMIY